jgi:FKBP-type peptidyl-prolyl cis-trans isomerase (trigger factor)
MIHDFEHRLQEQRLSIDDYLKLNSTTMEELRADFTEGATTSLKQALILGELLDAEHLEVTDEEIEDEIQTMLLSFGSQSGAARQLFSSKETRQSIRNRLLSDKSKQRLRLIARGEAPAIEKPDATEADQPAKPPRKKASKSKSAESADASVEAESETKPRKRKKAATTSSETNDSEQS